MGFLMTFAVLAALGLIGILVSLSLRVSRALRLADMANQRLTEFITVSADLLAGIKADADEMLKTAVEYSDQDRDMSRSLAEFQKQLAEHHRSIVRVSDDVHAVKKLVKLEGQQKQVQSLVNQSLQGVVVGGMDSKPGARNRGAKPSAGKTSAK